MGVPDLVLAFPDPSGPIGPIGPMAALTKASTTSKSVYSAHSRMYARLVAQLDWTWTSRTHGRGPDPCHGPVQQLPLGSLTAHTCVKSTMCLRQAGAIADIDFLHSGQSTSHSIPAKQHKI